MNDGFYNIKYPSNFKLIVIHQVTNGKQTEYLKYFSSLSLKGVTYIQADSAGLSKSRNMALSIASSPYVWIMDDDVQIFPDSYDFLIKLIDSVICCDLFLLNFTVNAKENKAFFIGEQNSLSLKSKSRFTVFNVSSINMLIKLDFVRKHNIFFNEKFGLGTDLPSGEEFLFCQDILSNGGQMQQTNIVVSKHPPVTSGMDFYSSDEKLRAKKMIFLHAFGIPGWIFFLLFLIKKSPVLIRSKSISRVFKVLFE